MSNPNIAMLENVISAAVSTQYKEVPPTEEEFLTLAQTMRTSMSMFSVTDGNMQTFWFGFAPRL